VVAISIFSLFCLFCYAQEASERKLVLRRAQECGKTTVAVEVYLSEDVL